MRSLPAVPEAPSSCLDHPESRRSRPPYKNPFVRLGTRLMLLFLWGIVTWLSALSSSSATLASPELLIVASVPDLVMPPRPLIMLPATLPSTDPFSDRSIFQLSSSRSSLAAFSCSLLSSRSARRACSWLDDSDDCSSSIVLRSLSILSRIRPRSSCICVFCLSLRSIWV